MGADNILIAIHVELGATICICLGAAIILFIHTDGVRSRSFLAWMMLVWGLIFLAQFFSSFFNQGQLPNRSMLSPVSLSVGNLGIVLPMYYVIEVVRPGWLAGWRVVRGVVPSVVLVAGYYVTMALLGQEPLRIDSWQALVAGLGTFDVGYRLFMLVMSQIYILIILLMLGHYTSAYRRWAEDNHSSPETTDVAWIRNYLLGFFALGAVFVMLQLNNEMWRYLPYYPVVTGLFGYILYKGVTHQNAYPEGYFRHLSLCVEANDDDEPDDATDADPACLMTEPAGKEAFLRQLDGYKAKFDEWMQTEKPYLRPNFRRADVNELFPINRTYLSRIFNEGYQMSFSQIVRHYRIEEARRLLKTRPLLTAKMLSSLCGFSTPAMFHRAFAEATGQTLTEYRLQEEMKRRLEQEEVASSASVQDAPHSTAAPEEMPAGSPSYFAGSHPAGMAFLTILLL